MTMKTLKSSDRLLGFIDAPKSPKQRRLALSGKRFIEGLTCFDAVKGLLLNRVKVSTIRRFVLEKNESGGLTAGSLDKYIQLYRRFFVAPIEYMRARNPNIPEKTDLKQTWASKLGMLPERIKEIEDLKEVVELQKERILEMRAFEKQIGVPLPDLDKSVQIGIEGYKTLTELMMDLGQLVRVPQRITGNFKVGHHVDLTALTEEEKNNILEFGQLCQEMLDMTTQSGNYGKCFLGDGVSNNGKPKLH
jgi:hypothetical protein